MAACAAPLVGWLARYQFGFTGTASVGPDHAENLAKARSLGSALLAFTAVPWTLCVLFFTPLHWTYPRDRCERSIERVLGMCTAAGLLVHGHCGAVGISVQLLCACVHAYTRLLPKTHHRGCPRFG